MLRFYVKLAGVLLFSHIKNLSENTGIKQYAVYFSKNTTDYVLFKFSLQVPHTMFYFKISKSARIILQLYAVVCKAVRRPGCVQVPAVTEDSILPLRT
jgi:hypothetical protein